MERIETRGIVLYNRNFREEDKLVKILTEKAGKRMFFVKHAAKSRLSACIQPLTVADFIVKVPEDGLCYIEDFHQVQSAKRTTEDIFKFSHAVYLLALVDACLQDGVVDGGVFDFLAQMLALIEEGKDEEILTNIVEIQLLQRFGISLNLHECAFCHRVGLPFDYSYRYAGVLCPEHYHRDERRSHLDPNVLYLLDCFQSLSFSDVQTISIKPEMKRKIRDFLDQLYDEYVGINLKSKKFLDGLSVWGETMKQGNKTKEKE